MEAALNQLQLERQATDRQQQGEETRAQRQDIHDDRSVQRDIAQGQLGNYREGLLADKQKGEADRHTLMLTHLLNDPQTDPAIKKAIQNKVLGQAGVSATLPVDPAKAALARSKGLPVPQGEVVGGQPQSATNQEGTPGTLAPNGYPILPNTPETSFTGRGHGSLEGSREVAGGLQTPSGGFIGADTISPRLGQLIHPGETAPANVASTPTTSTTPNTSFSPSNLAEARPDIAGTARPGLGALKGIGSAIGGAIQGASSYLGGVTPSPESVGAHPEIQPTARPGLTALSGLFGGGQGGVNQLVGSPNPKEATPAPGTQFQGPVTATAGFLGTPNAPAPQPALTPPAIPPTIKPTPEEERRRLLAGQQ